MTPSNIENIYESASLGFSKMIQSGRKPILLTSPILRFTIYEFFAPILPEIVLSYNDITPRVQFKTIDRIKMIYQMKRIKNLIRNLLMLLFKHYSTILLRNKFLL